MPGALGRASGNGVKQIKFCARRFWQALSMNLFILLAYSPNISDFV